MNMLILVSSFFDLKFVAKEGDTVEPGTKIAVISKSGEGANATHVAPSEEKNTVKEAPKPSAPAEKEKKPSVETVVAKEKPKTPSPAPSRTSATEPILPPKERERRVSFMTFSFYVNMSVIFVYTLS